MRHILDLDRWPLQELDGLQGQALVARCRDELRGVGMFSLDALIRPDALKIAVAEVAPVLAAAVNHTICGDQIPDSAIARIYEWQPLIDFLAATMGKSRLYPMADPLGRINVMAYHEGDQLNWHFDRAEFTTTVVLQGPCSGGEFRYRSALRSESDPNYDGVARLLAGQDERVQTLALEPGTLNVFMGKNTAHRVTPVKGDRPRIVAVFSYYETPGFAFSDSERVGFYGRTASAPEVARPDECRTRPNPSDHGTHHGREERCRSVP